MNASTPLPDWAFLAQTPDDRLPLLESALLIAHDEYPDLDAAACEALLQSHAEALREEVMQLRGAPLKMQAVNRHLFEELGYAGNHEAYYDPRNSYLNQVLERRLGNPISLALVQMEVTRRLGIPLDGVAFPGHFLVRIPVEDGLLVMDPFNRGRPLNTEELRHRARPHMGEDLPDETLLKMLSPAPRRAILMRILRNLQGAYWEQQDWPRAVRCCDRLLHLAPDHGDALRDRGLAYLALGHLKGARHDLGRYLQLQPEAGDADSVRERLVDAGGSPARLH